MLESGPSPEIGRDPAAPAWLERTRSGVLNVLVAVGAGIAASGLVLGRHEPDGALPWGEERTRRASHAALFVLAVSAYLVLRVGSGRESLRPAPGRGVRFFRARVASAAVAGLAIPLGFAHGWALDPRLPALAPFWVAALGLGFLALPRGHELDGFDEPIREV